MSRQINIDLIDSLQKETLINSFKKELYDLQDRQHEFISLENDLTNVQSKYAMLEDEKERIQSENRMKLDINRKSIVELRTEADSLKMQIHKLTVHVEGILRDIAGLKRTCESRQNELAALLASNQQMNARNEQVSEENKNQAIKIKNLKEERHLLDLESERYLKSLEESVNLLKTLEKEARLIESANNKLNSILSTAEIDNTDLIEEMKSREEIVSITYKKLDSLNIEIDGLCNKTKKLQKDCLRSEQDYVSISQTLEIMIVRNKDHAKQIKCLQNQLRLIENDYDAVILDRDALCNEHQNVSAENKILNDEIDRVLMEIMEAERVYAELQKEFGNYLALDEEAKVMLNRREKTMNNLETVAERLQLTGGNIAHLR